MGSIGWTNVQFLRKKGVDARLVLFKPRRLRPYEIDVNLDVPDNFVQRQVVQFRALADLLPTTDVFHFYFGLTLVPKRLQFPILDMYGKKSVFHYLGSDIRGKTPAELAYGKRASAEIVGSFDAIRWVPEAHVVPNGLDLSKYRPVPPPRHDRVRVVHAPTSRQKKGTQWIVDACARLPVELDVVENTRHDQAVERYKQADIVVDQLNAGWYGVFALECMALGKPVLTFLHEEAVRRTEEAFGVRLPLVPTSKETLEDDLRALAEQPELRGEIGRRSRAYVERVHDANVIADRLIGIYESL
jgi:glycosyltransferase involved in cell wall biosynthesis